MTVMLNNVNCKLQVLKPVARRKGKESKKSKASKKKKKQKILFSREDRLLLSEETIDDKDERKGDTESESKMADGDDVADDDDQIDNFGLLTFSI